MQITTSKNGMKWTQKEQGSQTKQGRNLVQNILQENVKDP